ncbi:MAG: glycosyltransferase 87 family protein, partial [bacterium]
AFVLSYPRTYAIVDEDAYLTQAWLFRTGRATYEDSSLPPPHMTVESGGRLASKYPPGASLILLPFTLAGWRAPFAAGLVLALAGTLLFCLIMRRMAPAAAPAWALLWLCYPAVTLYSRTLMSDLPAAVLVLAAFLALIRERRLLAGLLLGFSVLVRYSNAVFVPVFGIIALASARPRLRGVGAFLLGLVPGAALALGWNQLAYGGPLSFPMYLTGEFSPAFLPRNAVYYGTSLLVLYPLMLILPLAVERRWRLAVALPAYAGLGLYCCFSYIYDVPGLAERLTIGLRYLLPGLGFFILGTALLLARLERLLPGFRVFRFALLGLALAGSLAVHWRHDRYLAVQDRYRRLVYELVPDTALVVCNKDVSELFSHVWGDRNYLRFAEFEQSVAVDAAIAESADPWAVLLQKPGRRSAAETAIFSSLLGRYPDAALVVRESLPWSLEAWRLRPPAGPGQPVQ